MFRIGKDMEGRYCSILLQGILVVEVKIRTVTDDHIIGENADNTDVVINHDFVLAYWPDKAKDLKTRKREEKKRAKTPVD